MPKDNFKLSFDQGYTFDGNEYFLQTLADDRVNVKVNNQYKINRTANSGDTIDRALLGKLTGKVPISTVYNEVRGNAALFSDVVPYGNWLAYYYNNTDTSGRPVAAEQISNDNGVLSQDYGSGSPAPDVHKDQFSARYTTAKHIKAGSYIIRARADDGIRVLVDGKKIVDHWSPSRYGEDTAKINISDGENGDVHWIEVDYFERAGKSKLYFTMNPSSSQVSDNGWYGELFPNKTLSGQPVINGGSDALKQVPDLDFNWGNGSPDSKIPSNNFSGIFKKKLNVSNSNYYHFNVKADDGVRVMVDGKKIIDSWHPSNNGEREATVYLGKGQHDLTVEYFEGTGAAQLNFKVSPAKTFSRAEQSVHYDWGAGSPGAGFPKDNFYASFDQSRNFPSDDYFMQTLADDGIRVNMDGKDIINRWSPSAGDIDRAVLGHLSGHHTFQTDYFERRSNAFIYSDIVPFNNWLAYYYNNQDLSGAPVNAKVIPHGDNGSFEENNGSGSPMNKVNSDHFSARYVTAKHLAPGKYVIRTRADDGVRVLVDGKKVSERWTNSAYKENAVKINLSNTNGSDVHWIEVQYYDRTSASHVFASIEPFKLSTDSWIGEYYSNENLQGQGLLVGGDQALNPIDSLNLKWGAKAPSTMLPEDHFSASFQKLIDISEPGTYTFSVKADDGVRVSVDGKKIIDSWHKSDGGGRTGKVALTSGKHAVKVDYFEHTGDASIDFSYEKAIDFKDTSPSIHYNWGTGSPSGVPPDHFLAEFDQSKKFDGKEYFAQTYADDRIKLSLNNKIVIDGWNTTGTTNRALLGKLSGVQSIKSSYYEETGNAAIYSDVVPFGNWLAYYYNNTSMSGNPIDANVLSPSSSSNLEVDNGTGSPTGKVNADRFSAKYVTAKRIPSGDYIFRAKANDGVRIIVDGKTVINRLTSSSYQENAVKLHLDNLNGSDVHWIEVQYVDHSGQSKLNLSIEPIQVSSDNWLAEYYPNKDLAGNAVVVGGENSLNQIPKVAFNWVADSPDSSIPVDDFSARYQKIIHLDSTATYQFKANADDGVRVFVDGKLIIDHWGPSQSTTFTENLDLAAGNHTVKVEYLELSGYAKLNFSYQILQKKVFKYDSTAYSSTLGDALAKQMRTNPQTDVVYIYSSGVDVDANNNNKGTVNGTYNVRVWPGTENAVSGLLNNGTRVTILDRVKDYDGDTWYKIIYPGFVDAGQQSVMSYLDPSNFERGTSEFYQFLKLNQSANLDVNEINTKILKGKGILENKASSFIKAGQQFSINEIYLISHALLETGNGASQLAQGVCYDPAGNTIVDDCSRGKKVYNMYGIGAYDKSALLSGAATAYSYGWFSPEAAIIGGARFVSENYIQAGQDTLYKMRWHPSAPATHQYATDIGWAAKQTYKINSLYDLLSSYTNVYDIPTYQ